jgi:hypothetical protein
MNAIINFISNIGFHASFMSQIGMNDKNRTNFNNNKNIQRFWRVIPAPNPPVPLLIPVSPNLLLLVQSQPHVCLSSSHCTWDGVFPFAIGKKALVASSCLSLLAIR